ncbi:MAG: hypothetical protein Q4D87_04210 [Actinomycetaceae bacterium]|nr:hypothetical protein [Actinomycetaceae bacterium]
MLIENRVALSSICVEIGAPDHPVTLQGLGLDPELLEVSVLAALQRTGQQSIDFLQLPGINADSLIPKELIVKLRDLVAEGLVHKWGIRARTVKQAMRAMSFLGLDFVSVSAADLGMSAVPGILRAANRAKMPVMISVSADTSPLTIAEIRDNPSVLAVLIEARNEQEQALADRTLTSLSSGKEYASAIKIA